ncbi:hypothetical protein ACMD2_16387 [Ananas comosus]|uniref:Uncharacterized protein n=1 Tax=Ananas comosus TaxID=4615 RepID=A0A199W8T9_ANACO|nr:hypothetical protein ACMD2_16387 [Ananas comosus]
MPATAPLLRGKFLMLVTRTAVPSHALLLVAMHNAIHNCHNRTKMQVAYKATIAQFLQHEAWVHEYRAPLSSDGFLKLMQLNNILEATTLTDEEDTIIWRRTRRDGHIHRAARYAAENLKQLYTSLITVIIPSSLGPNAENSQNIPTGLYYSQMSIERPPSTN